MKLMLPMPACRPLFTHFLVLNDGFRRCPCLPCSLQMSNAVATFHKLLSEVLHTHSVSTNLPTESANDVITSEIISNLCYIWEPC
jgi:hypothetical protein